MSKPFFLAKELSSIQGVVVIIPAAGIGRRMASSTPKQYLKIDNKSILEITINQFLSFEPVELVVVVVSANDSIIETIDGIDNKKIILIEGGDERVNSVNNALCFLSDNELADDVAVMVHDAARPCITHGDLNELLSEFNISRQPCFLASSITDTVQKIDKSRQVTSTVNRDDLVKALTPQMARNIDLKNALDAAIKEKRLVTDEVSALVEMGLSVHAVKGRSDNIKITSPSDLGLAEYYLANLFNKPVQN